MKFYRKKTQCKDCPLADQTTVRGTGPRGAKIAFIGEAPGAVEDELGEPFVGPAGKYFTGGLYNVGIDRSRCWVTNVLCHRPPKNEFNSIEGREAQKACLPGFYEELAWLVENGARIFVPLGNHACSAFGLSGGIFKIRGSVYLDERWPGIPILPTFHPSFLNRRTMGKKYSGGDDPNPISVDPKYIWWADLKKAKRIAEEGWTPPEENFNLFPSLEDLEEFSERVLAEGKEIAVDIETTGFNLSYARIVVIGLADSPTTGISVPLSRKGGGPYWPNGQQNEVKKIVSKIFQGNPLLFQNALFDIPFLQRDGFEIDYDRVEDDIMLLHHCLTGDTEIDTLRGRIPIKDLDGKEDFWLVSHDGNNLVPRKARKCWRIGKRSDIFRITFWSKDRADKSKMWIDLTSDHEVPIQGKGKVKVRDLKVGDRLFRGQTNGRSYSEANRLRWEKNRNCRILSITPLKGEQEVYDIEVPETHTFSANGIIVGNSVCPELPHNLGFIVSLYGDTPYWKEDFLNRTTGILELEDEELRIYNLRDCVVLHQVLPGLRKDLEEIGTERVYREESLALLPVIADMKKWGIGIDKGRLSRYRSKLTKDIASLEGRLVKEFSFPKSFKFSDHDIGWFLYGEEPTKFRKLKELREYDPETTTKKKPLKKETKKYRELLEILEIKEQAAPLYYPTGWKGRKSPKTGRLKTDDQGRLSFQIALQNRLDSMSHFVRLTPKHQEEKEKIEKLLGFLKDFNELKRMKKELTSYTNFKIDPDGRVRNSLLIHGTATGRLACRA